MKNIKTYLIAGGLVVAFALYVIFSQSNSSSIALNNQSPSTTGTLNNTGASSGTGSTGSGSGNGNAGSGSSRSGSASTGSTGQYKNGTYTGSVADAFYGNVQVQAVISGGKLSNINFLQYPSDSGHSMEVSNVALPVLRSEAIASQSANVNTVSGATQTSDAFQQSLASALGQAQ